MHISTVGGESLDNVREISINQSIKGAQSLTVKRVYTPNHTHQLNSLISISNLAAQHTIFGLSFTIFVKKLKYFDILLNDLAF